MTRSYSGPSRTMYRLYSKSGSVAMTCESCDMSQSIIQILVGRRQIEPTSGYSASVREQAACTETSRRVHLPTISFEVMWSQ